MKKHPAILIFRTTVREMEKKREIAIYITRMVSDVWRKQGTMTTLIHQILLNCLVSYSLTCKIQRTFMSKLSKESRLFCFVLEREDGVKI